MHMAANDLHCVQVKGLFSQLKVEYTAIELDDVGKLSATLRRLQQVFSIYRACHVLPLLVLTTLSSMYVSNNLA